MQLIMIDISLMCHLSIFYRVACESEEGLAREMQKERNLVQMSRAGGH